MLTERQMIGLNRSGKIEKIEYPEEGKIIVTTKNLKYIAKCKHTSKYDEDCEAKTHCDRKLNNKILGAYKILILINEDRLRIANYTKISNNYHHMCIDEDGDVCFGGNVKRIINKQLLNRTYHSLILTIINFLEEPNYESSFIEDYDYFDFLENSYEKHASPIDWFNKYFYE